MADCSEKVSLDISEEKECVQTQMLPPSIPLSSKKKDKKCDASKRTEKSVISTEEDAEMPLPKPPSEDSTATELERNGKSSLKTNDENEKAISTVFDDKQEKSEKDDGTYKSKNPEKNMLPPELPSVEKKNEKVEQEQSKKDVDKKDYPEVPYTEPSWAGIPQDPYYLELLKGGCIISTKRLTSKSYYLFGRLPNCDMTMEHPSISRYHAIIQYKASDSANGKKGFYLYDLGSTHGTKVNKIVIQPQRYYRLQVGYVIKFGGSSRLYILQGPEDIEEDDLPSDDTVKPSNEVGKVMTEAEYEEWKKEKEKKPEEESESCSWGFGEDAVEEDVANPFASALEEEMDAHVFKDPKKTLRGFFEREGLDLEYQVEETGPGHARVYHCRVKLPVEDSNGDPLYAEAAVTGKKREAVLACAGEACRLLDVNGLLRQSSHESKKQKLKNWEENDYYDSDEDTFLDRTGSIEKKRLKRMKMSKKEKEEIETFESLSSKLQSLEEEIKILEEKLDQAVKAAKAAEESEDSLESYMKNIDKSMDRTSRMQMRRKIFDLKKERQKLSKLVEISRPAFLPSLVKKDLSSKDFTKEEVTRTEASSTTVVESVPLVTADSNTDTRHEKAESTDSQAQPSVSSTSNQDQGSTTSPKNVEEMSDKRENNQKTETFLMPKLPAPKHKPKAPPPSSSISMLLEGLKESSGSNKEKHTKTEKRSRKQKPDKEEPPQKKKVRLPRPPSPTFAVWLDDDEDDYKEKSSSSSDEDSPEKKKFDETYSNWVPPTDQTGDGRTKLNEKYGY